MSLLDKQKDLSSRQNEESGSKSTEAVPLHRLNLPDELSEALSVAKRLMQLCDKESSDVPMNQRAQVVNSLVATIGQINKTRNEIYDAERIRQIESATISVLKQMDTSAKERFLELMGIRLATLGEDGVDKEDIQAGTGAGADPARSAAGALDAGTAPGSIPKLRGGDG